MFPKLLALFILLPFIELIVLIKVYARLGMGSTIALVVATGIIGATLARFQGLMVVERIQRDLANGELPAPHLVDGVLILVAAAFLVTPGLITDTAGFALLVPPVRATIRMWLRQKFERNLNPNVIDIIDVDDVDNGNDNGRKGIDG